MRGRPVPGVNPIAWLIWHAMRIEDVCVNRFVLDRPQVLDDGWLARLAVSRHDVGTGMTDAQVDALCEAVDVEQLRGYCRAVTRATLDAAPLLRGLQHHMVEVIFGAEERRRHVVIPVHRQHLQIRIGPHRRRARLPRLDAHPALPDRAGQHRRHPVRCRGVRRSGRQGADRQLLQPDPGGPVELIPGRVDIRPVHVAQRDQAVGHHPRVLPGHDRHPGLSRGEEGHRDAR